MTKKIIVAVAVGALACGLSVSSASAKHHPKHHGNLGAETTPAKSSTAAPIAGVNPMTNADPIPAAPHKMPYSAVPGVNPM